LFSELWSAVELVPVDELVRIVAADMSFDQFLARHCTEGCIGMMRMIVIFIVVTRSFSASTRRVGRPQAC
jgi:hypothetical protein